jgi:acetyl/propionyl-CoA carboxylase alpha subunit
MGEDQSLERLKSEADAIGYPVLIKAVAGGGGKGMRRVDASEAFLDALGSCRREAASSFGDDRVLIEKYILSPRHIEVQVFGDSHGEVVHLYERDCSLQRRHQKVIEEAPAPGMDAATRAAITDAAIKAAKAVNYVGAGTIEFIADGTDGLRADRIWFMEMNTRLQVEHPVTESITGVDLVEWQFRAAAGEAVPLKQADISMNGWAMEARLYAEDPANGFLPSIGKLEHFRLPDDIRVDTGVFEGGEVSQFYDPMIAKLIVHADTREAATSKLADACGEVEVWPVKTNAGFLKRCLDHPKFVAGDVDTGFIAAEQEALIGPLEREVAVLGAAVLIDGLARDADMELGIEVMGPWSPTPRSLFGFRLNASPGARLRGFADGVQADLTVKSRPDWSWEVDSGEAASQVRVRWSSKHGRRGVYVDDDRVADFRDFGDEVVVFRHGVASSVSLRPPREAVSGSASDGSLRAPMPGKIVAMPAKAGDTVIKGQPIVVLEAMKMEHALTAPFNGVVGEIGVAVGDQVAADTVLAVVTAEA